MTPTGPAPAAPRIVELELQIRPFSDEKKGYPVLPKLWANNQDHPFDEALLQLDIDLLARKLPVPEEYDQMLTTAFFQGSVQEAFLTARTLADATPNTLLRVRHYIDSGAEALHKVRWECLKDSAGKSLFQGETVLFSRYLSTDRLRPLSGGTGRNALIVISNPPGLGDAGNTIDPENPGGKLAVVDVENEKLRAMKALGAGFQITTLASAPHGEAPVTLDNIIAKLGRAFDGILYLVCHGGFVDGVPMLWLEDGPQPVAATKLIEFISNMEVPPRLVVLASCQSAGTELRRRAASGTLAALGPQLGHAGVPAVVAMQGCVEMATADTFMPVFFTQLLQDGQVDRAMGIARAAAARRAGCDDYWMPVLFMRLRSGQLFVEAGRFVGDFGPKSWEALVRRIRGKTCTPILGPDVSAGLFPSYEEIATALAGSDFPFGETTDLRRVSQYIGSVDDDGMRQTVVDQFTASLRRVLKEAGAGDEIASSSDLKAAHWAAISRIFESQIYNQLAGLGLPLYITTAFGNFMKLALEARQGKARQDVVPWMETPQERDYDPQPTPDNPVVLHLFGTDADPASMVLTEDDHLDYLTSISRDQDIFLPKSVTGMLAGNTLLFLGYHLENLDLKVILRGLLGNPNMRQTKRISLGVQIDSAKRDPGAQQEVTRFFEKALGRYFPQGSSVAIYWGSAQQFVAELTTKMAQVPGQ